MVNAALKPDPAAPSPADPEVALALSYAPPAARGRLLALWGFDAKLAEIVRTTSEPLIGRMRLTWWHDAVTGDAPPRGEPLVAAVNAAELPRAALARMIDGWEALLDGDDGQVLADYASGRGGGLFAAAAAVLDTPASRRGGEGWVLVDLARHHSAPAVAARALALARQRLAEAPVRWDRAARPLGALVKLARRDLNGVERQGAPRRVLAAGWLALTGR